MFRARMVTISTSSTAPANPAGRRQAERLVFADPSEQPAGSHPASCNPAGRCNGHATPTVDRAVRGVDVHVDRVKGSPEMLTDPPLTTRT